MKESSGRNRVENRIEVKRKKERGDVENNIFDLRQRERERERANRRYFHFVSFTFVVFCVFFNFHRNNLRLLLK